MPNGIRRLWFDLLIVLILLDPSSCNDADADADADDVDDDDDESTFNTIMPSILNVSLIFDMVASIVD